MPVVLDLARRISIDDLVIRFRECTPRLLVVTDGSLNAGAGGFGLSQFVATLAATPIHGMLPIVDTRARGGNDEAFDDLSISRFDVVFLFGWNGEGDPLNAAALNRISAFMQAGGGLFATGDHEDMGAGMCGQLPRVRQMRFWAQSETPDAADPTRMTTNFPGGNGIFEFGDQSDGHPQRLYANFAIPPDTLVLAPFPPLPGSTVRQPHPLLRMADGSALDLYPDHPHEGECRLPDDLGTTIDVDGRTVPEWPRNGWWSFPRPRLVASSMSYGNGFPGKEAVAPRDFIAIAAYNGQPAGVGRVVTDATWHHYVNVNLNGLAAADLDRIKRFWSNLATWLMPARTRKCLWPFHVITALLSHELAEEIRIPVKGRVAVPQLQRLGGLVAAALDTAPGSPGSQVVADVLGGLVDGERLPDTDDERLRALPLDRPATDMALTVLGAAVVELARIAADGRLEHSDDLFDKLTAKAAGAAREALDTHRQDLARAMDAADALEKALA